MFVNLFMRRIILAILLALGLLVLGQTSLQAGEPVNLHVLVTSEVTGRIEPSG